jgi:tetratricopeptide (TPR) repeat protein
MGLDNLKAAVSAFEEALEVLSAETHPHEWVQVQGDLGRALYAWGLHTRDGDGWRLLNDAVDVYRQALTKCTFESMPEQWASLQGDLGTVLSALGERAPGDSGLEYLEAAVEAFDAAQTVNVPSGKSWDAWRLVQHQLGDVLVCLAGRTTGERTAAYERRAFQVTRAGSLAAVAQLRKAEVARRKSR